MKLFSSCFQQFNCVMAAGFAPGLSDSQEIGINLIGILQLSMSIATMKEEIVGATVRLNQAMRQQFPKHRHS